MTKSTGMQQNLPIVMISMSRWDGDFSSAAWSIARTFAQSQPVIYVDYPYTFADFVRERKQPSVQARQQALLFGKGGLKKLEQFAPHLYALTPPLMLPCNSFEDGALYRTLQNRNNKVLARSILKALKSLGFRDFVFYNSFNPLYLTTLPKGFRPKAVLYQSRDNIRALEPYLRKHGAGGEITAIQNADVSFATSRQLQRDLAELSGEEVEYLPNAASFGTFRKAYEDDLPRPMDLAEIRGPIIGYTGNICHRQNYDILQRVCEVHADKNVVLVGPRNHAGHTDIDLDAIPNLHFLGPKKIDDLPAYLAHFDALILPFKCNEVTKSIYPLKINEYLASGKPVIATPFSEDIQSFGDVIALADGPDAFAAAITEALTANTSEKARKRYERASQNTWEQRVEQIRAWMGDVMG
ncbi:Glycosyl transferases group 1 [Cyclonatronum proteinivorum]|uniref:Glycosyl transferases group 1 n=1 Tax=Cyclonatronum proteinivorum TaxID=1457365 RepID=A0A345UIL3_9BACT|nr:glycosyltransferase [Cyclonatronum proteinivorum]AXJ00315.1 Glycosyl transferases group 1 [Cyclonatronum proteinivorum]